MINYEDLGVDEKIRPPKDMACRECKFAVWSIGRNTNYRSQNEESGVEFFEKKVLNHEVKCYCKNMFKTTFEVSNIKQDGKNIIRFTTFDYVLECEGKDE